MNKIVLEHYPTSNLPEDIRQAVGDVGSVKVTVEPEARAGISRDELVRRLRNRRPEPGVTMEEAVARIRALRDEWDD